MSECSDHHLLKNLTPWTKNQKSEENTLLNYNLPSLNSESVKLLYQKRLNKNLRKKYFDNNDKHYQHINECIHAAAKEALGLYVSNKRQTPYWWGSEIDAQIEVKRKAYPKNLNYQSPRKSPQHYLSKKKDAWERNCSFTKACHLQYWLSIVLMLMTIYTQWTEETPVG